jgi:hypothetical protein
MSSRSISRIGTFSARRPSKAVMALLVLSVFATAGNALAQTTGSVEIAPSQPAGELPPGGCMPIGVTASGEIVFPLTCRAFLEKRRGRIEEPQFTGASGKQDTSSGGAATAAATPAQTAPAIRPVVPIAAPSPTSDGDRGKRSRHTRRHRYSRHRASTEDSQ